MPKSSWADIRLERLENAVVEVEKRKIQREAGGNAQKAMESLEVSKSQETNDVKSSDVDYIVSYLIDLALK